MIYFRIFFEKIKNSVLKFPHIWTKHTICRGNFDKTLKIFDENSIEKLNFYQVLGRVVAKKWALGNNISFLQQFFPVRGGGLKPLSPMRRPLLSWDFCPCKIALFAKENYTNVHVKVLTHSTFRLKIFLLFFNFLYTSFYDF